MQQAYGKGKQVKIGGVQLGNVLMNAAYIHSKTLQDVEALASSAAGAMVVGSISVKPRGRNPGQGYWRHKERFFSLNSFGLPNGGIPYFAKNLPKMVRLAHENNKPLIANVVGFAKEDYAQLVPFVEQLGADMAELNFGCPNVWDGGKQKRIISYHASLVRDTLDAIAKQNPTIKISVKISPLPPDILQEVAAVVAESRIVHAVTACNSYPNAAITSGAQGAGGPSDVLAGLTGRALKPISLGVIRQLRAILPKRIDIIGAGGIYTANDVQDYLDAGAKSVQIASALTDDGLSVFDKILYQQSSNSGL
jgi:dihydroorotate dehydrogenase (fumarate)